MKHILGIAGSALAFLTLFGCGKTNEAASAADASAQDYAALGALPDWSGAWTNYFVAHNQLMSNEEKSDRPPLKDPEKMAKFLEIQATINGGGDNTTAARRGGANLGFQAPSASPRGGPPSVCGGGAPAPGSAKFVGRTGSAPETVTEFLFTPGRITILTDGNIVRRIYTRGQEIPKDVPTAMGFSVGHWEGETLVVHTTNLDPETRLPGFLPVGEAGEGFTIDERIHLKQADVLEIDATITAPDLFSGPYHLPLQLLAKTPFRPDLLQNYLGDCTAHDRSVVGGGGQQFDLTPPEDIPPPPVTQ